MQQDYKKIVVNSILYTLLVMIVLFAVFVMLMFFVFTRHLADFMYDVGFDSMASRLYYSVYEKNNEIVYCYKALNIKISLQDHDKVIEYYEAFINDDEYEEFIFASKENAENLNVSILEKSTLLNEENYLTNSYVKALLANNEYDKALNIATTEFFRSEVLLKNQGVYALSHFVDKYNVNVFSEIYLNCEDDLINEMQNYFIELNDLFDESKSLSSELDKSYIFALGNRIIMVGQDVNKIYGYMNINADTISSNNNLMQEVNNFMKGLL